MEQREFKFEITLEEAQSNIDNLRKILEHRHPGEVPYYSPHKLIWCINSHATRCLILQIGKCKHLIYTEVASQAFPQDWDWVNRCFGVENIRLLAVSDAKHLLRHMLLETEGVYNLEEAIDKGTQQ